MLEYLTYQEKCILFAAIRHERKYADDINNGEDLLKVCDSLDNKFMYDKLFKKIRNDTIDEFVKNCQNEVIKQNEEMEDDCDILDISDIEKIANKLKIF